MLFSKEVKCKHSCSGFEIVSPIPFPTTISITLSAYACMYEYMVVYVCIKVYVRIADILKIHWSQIKRIK